MPAQLELERRQSQERRARLHIESPPSTRSEVLIEEVLIMSPHSNMNMNEKAALRVRGGQRRAWMTLIEENLAVMRFKSEAGIHEQDITLERDTEFLDAWRDDGSRIVAGVALVDLMDDDEVYGDHYDDDEVDMYEDHDE